MLCYILIRRFLQQHQLLNKLYEVQGNHVGYVFATIESLYINTLFSTLSSVCGIR